MEYAGARVMPRTSHGRWDRLARDRLAHLDRLGETQWRETKWHTGGARGGGKSDPAGRPDHYHEPKPAPKSYQCQNPTVNPKTLFGQNSLGPWAGHRSYPLSRSLSGAKIHFCQNTKFTGKFRSVPKFS